MDVEFIIPEVLFTYKDIKLAFDKRNTVEDLILLKYSLFSNHTDFSFIKTFVAFFF